MPPKRVKPEVISKVPTLKKLATRKLKEQYGKAAVHKAIDERFVDAPKRKTTREKREEEQTMFKMKNEWQDYKDKVSGLDPNKKRGFPGSRDSLRQAKRQREISNITGASINRALLLAKKSNKGRDHISALEDRLTQKD